MQTSTTLKAAYITGFCILVGAIITTYKLSLPNKPKYVVQAAHEDLASRCSDLGTAVLRFVEERKQAQPDAKSHQQEYLGWVTTNDVGFRTFYYDDVKALQKDLTLADIRDPDLDELIAKHERLYAAARNRNQLPLAPLMSNAPMYHLSIDDIEEIGKRFKYLASHIHRRPLPNEG
jgi:hypothetical protein